MPRLILVAEDDPALQSLFTTLFTAEGYAVEIVATGTALVQRATRVPYPDLILTDVDMPGMSGIIATSFLRTHPATATVPIVVQSANVLHGLAAKDAGATVFFVKPVDLDYLLATVAFLITKEEHHVHA